MDCGQIVSWRSTIVILKNAEKIETSAQEPQLCDDCKLPRVIIGPALRWSE